MVVIGEQIVVGTLFKNGAVLPKYFLWKGQRFLVKNIPLTYTKKAGQSNMLFFSVEVAEGSSVYELSFNSSSMIWKVERVEEGA